MSKLGEGNLTLFLKAECIRVSEGIFITLRAYATQALDLFGMLSCQQSATPMTKKLKLATEMNAEPVDPTYYRCLVGKLIHLTHTQPDISFAVGVVAQYMAWPQVSHLLAAKKILHYLSRTRDFGILYPKESSMQISGFVDADFVGDDKSTRSTTGLIFRIGDAPISWLSKRQSCIALSSSETEYMGLSVATRKFAWLEKLTMM